MIRNFVGFVAAAFFFPPDLDAAGEVADCNAGFPRRVDFAAEAGFDVDLDLDGRESDLEDRFIAASIAKS
ncbi:hypothetical protein Poly51_47580 [Rubripirellula tenax]|uniref:Uncharacterized protein n=1 Tax=Rubripirellula tenax TaxID=2528015 RepID=A0A5C6EJX1_9BACT|nr:hypothetical protein Poly51_47580 [Rubripirellula tenax]